MTTGRGRTRPAAHPAAHPAATAAPYETAAPLATAAGDPATAARLAEAVDGVDAPDVVFAVTRGGVRTVASGGTAPPPPVPRESLRYELGSASKTFAGLLLAEAARAGLLGPDEPAVAHLPGPVRPRHPSARRITLRHLATHTSGLPRIPADLVPGALLRPHVNAYARYDTERLLHAFARTRPRFRPGTRWRYSNFGAALLGSALAHAAGAEGAEYPRVLERRVLAPLGLTATGVDAAAGSRGGGFFDAGSPGGSNRAGQGFGAGPPGAGDALGARTFDAAGHRADGVTPAAPADMAAFGPAGSVRSTPADLLTYLEALLFPGSGALSAPLRDVQVPLLRFGLRGRHVRTLTWIQHPAPGGPLLFHTGATLGQEAFLGFHPATGTGVAALATRRVGVLGRSVSGEAYEVLYGLVR